MEKVAITDKNIKECVSCFLNKETDNPLYHQLPPKMGDWDVSNVTDMSGLFSRLVDFNEDISGWELDRAEDLSYMFAGCTNFNCDLSNWYLENAKNTSYMFAGCENFTSDLNNWYVGSIRNASHMFDGCKKFTSSLVKKYSHMVTRFSKKQNKMIEQASSTWDWYRINDMSYIFQGCESLNADLRSWKDLYIKNMDGAFKGCKNLESDVSNWNVENIKNMKELFHGCSKMNCDLSRWNVLSIKDMTKQDVFNFYAGSKISSDKAPYFEPIDETESEKSYFSDDKVIPQQRPYMYYKCKQYKHIGYKKMTICDAIFLYQRHFDGYMNAIFRGHSTLTNKNLVAFLHNVIRIIDNYFMGPAPRITEKMVEEGTNVVYRGEKSLCEGGSCRQGIMPAYTSTSKSAIRAGHTFTSYEYNDPNPCCLYQCILEVGTPYIDVDTILEQSNTYCGLSFAVPGKEFEYLLPRGITFVPSELNETLWTNDLGTRRVDSTLQKFGIRVVYDSNYIKNNPISTSTITSAKRTRSNRPSSASSITRRKRTKSLSSRSARVSPSIRAYSSV